MLGSIGYLKIHSNKYLVCHFLISASPIVEVDEVKLSLVRVDNWWWLWRTACNHLFLGISSLKSVFLWFRVRNSLTDTQRPPSKSSSLSVIHALDCKTCSSPSLSTGEGPIECFEDLLVNLNPKLDLGVL